MSQNLKIDNRKVVTMTYTLSVIHPEGNLEFVDRRGEENPIEFVFGKGLLLPKVEAFLEGHTMGFEGQLKLKPSDGFGERNENLVLTYPKNKLPKEIPPQLGTKYQTQGPSGEVISVIVTSVDDEQVTLDGNHPLAGALVQFDLAVLKVREATEEELKSGQVKASLYH